MQNPYYSVLPLCILHLYLLHLRVSLQFPDISSWKTFTLSRIKQGRAHPIMKIYLQTCISQLGQSLQLCSEHWELMSIV